MKKLNLEEIQKKEYDILCEFDRICRENNLRYGLCGGTLLGAIRHQGFIPWDDDIDVEMPRPDYMKLVSVAKDVFPEYYELVTPYSDNDTIHAYGKICDLRTKLIEFPESKKIPTHLYIDIFPIDGMPVDPIAQEKHRKKTRKRMLTLYGYKIAKYKLNEKLNIFKKIFWRIAKIVEKIIPNQKLIKKVDKLALKYEFGTTKHCAVIVAGYGAREVMPIQVFDFSNEVVFEGKKFYATSKPDYYLTNIYGNYMQIPPIEQRIHHEMEAYEI